MDRRQYIINIAAFMIFLIVSLPIYSASAMGATINNVQIYGKDKISGYRGQTDTTTINVSVSIPEDPDLSPTQVKMVDDPTVPFDCQIIDEENVIFECLYEYPEISLAPDSGITAVTVQIFNDAGDPASPARQGLVTVDTLPPKVIDVNYSAKPGGLVEASFDIRDEACNIPECIGRCAGVSSVAFTVAGLSVGQNNSFRNECHQKGAINLTGLTVGGETVTKHICIEATDKLGQSGTECKDVVIDTQAPTVTGIGLVDSNNVPILYTNGQPRGNVNLIINITEASPFFNPISKNEYHLQVNASALSERPDHQESFSNRETLPCTNLTEGKYTCKVEGLYLIASTPRTLSIGIQAQDAHENILNESKSIDITFDNTPPVATKIYSSFFDEDGDYWVRGDDNQNIIYTDILESGSGMAGRMVYLDFTSFGDQASVGGAATVPPNSCESGWTCTWNGAKTDKSSGERVTLAPTIGSKDDAGNALQPVTGVFHVDKDEPEIDNDLLNHSNITGVGEGHDPMTNLSSGDALEIHMFVMDHSGIKSAKANLSELIEDGPEELEGECEVNQIIPDEEQKIFECTWSTDAIKDGYRKGISAFFTFDDYTNHTLVYEWDDIEILARENETGIVRWDVDITDWSPYLGIDRLSWGLASQRMYYEISMRSESDVDGLISLNFDPMQCYGLDWINQDTETGEFLVSMMEFYDFNENPTKDIVVLELNPGAVPEFYMTDEDGDNVSVDYVNVTCPFLFTSIVTSGSERALAMPETVNVTFEIPVFNNPLGQNIGNLKDKIKEEEEYVDQGIWKFVFWTNKILQYAKEICRFIETYIQLVEMWGGVKDLFGRACETVGTLPSGQSTCQMSNVAGTTTQQTSEATDSFMGELYYVCGLFISCRLSENARRSMNAQCTGASASDRNENWCRVKKWWGKWSNMWGEYAGMSWIENKYKFAGEVNTGQLTMSGDNETRGLHIFNPDDFDPTQSWISSALSLCLPGVMLNIEKFRQIKCKRLLCWKIDVPNGRPLWQCDKTYDYEICTYWIGQAFAAIPWITYVEQLGNVISKFIKQPVSAILGMVVDKVCSLFLCGNERAVGCKICKGVQYATSLAAIVTDLVTNTGDRFKAIKFDFCEEAIKDNPSYSNIEWPSGGTDDMADEDEDDTAAPAVEVEE